MAAQHGSQATFFSSWSPWTTSLPFTFFWLFQLTAYPHAYEPFTTIWSTSNRARQRAILWSSLFYSGMYWIFSWHHVLCLFILFKFYFLLISHNSTYVISKSLWLFNIFFYLKSTKTQHLLLYIVLLSAQTKFRGITNILQLIVPNKQNSKSWKQVS